MKVTIPEISWHNRDPVLALDVQPNPPDGVYRLATAGTDTHVVIWQLKILDNGAISVEALCDLTRHNRAVNTVRFSPSGEFLASADDEAAVFLWKKQESSEGDLFLEDSEKENKENWVIHKMLRGHLEDVYDICWSKTSQYLISGSVDNSAILWDVSKGKSISILKDHNGFVQGVAWDPSNQYIATLCSDRCCRIYSFATKKIVHRLDKVLLPTVGSEGTEKLTRLFYDDTLKSFCRRLAFSPDGEILLAPSGIVEGEEGKITNVTYVFSRYDFSKPALYLPTKDKYTLAVRFSPILYELKPLIKQENKEKMETQEGEEDKDDDTEEWRKFANLLDLPYRMVFAVATQNALFLYDTQQPVPFAKISNMHYTRLSDITWSSDGRILVVSSTDGYCSLVSFTKDELGIPYNKKKDTPQKADQSLSEDVEMASEDSPKHEKKSKGGSPPSVAEQKKTQDVQPKRITPNLIAVRRAGDSNKSGKRISITTLSGPSVKTAETTTTTEKPETAEEESNQSQKEVKDVDKQKDESSKPEKAGNESSPSSTPTRSQSRIALTTLSSSKDRRKDLDEVSKLSKTDAEAENKSPEKTIQESLTPNRTPSGSTKTVRRIPLTTVCSPKCKRNIGEQNSPAKSPQRSSRRIPLMTVSSPRRGKGAEELMELDKEVTKRFEGDRSPERPAKGSSPVKSPSSLSKTPRRVPLITLCSPKGKKSLGFSLSQEKKDLGGDSG